MKNGSRISVLLGTSLLVASACASVQPNQQISDAQARLTTDYNDKDTADRGQGDLTNAKAALESAQNQLKHGNRDKSDHQLRMAQTDLDIAETRGQQAKVDRSNARLVAQGQMAGKNQQIADQNQQLADKDEQLAGKDQQLASKDQELARADDSLREYNMKVTALGSTMVLQDVSFETGKSDLLPGGINRLQPLINYLRLSPMTRVKIDGYTDNVGGAVYNQDLSLDRANSVKATMTAGNIDGSRIETEGFGLNKPVASNKTVSGRQSNRRVEITLLKQPSL